MPAGGRHHHFLLALFLASGALAIIYEVLWMRRFTVLFGATAPAAAATLSSIFLGLSAGSAILGARSVRWSHPLRAYGILEIGVALGALLVEPLLDLFDRLYHSVYPSLSGHPAIFLSLKVLMAGAAVFIPSACMGATLPLLGEAVAGDRGRLGVRVSGLYGINLLGATAGALLVPFVLLPLLGTEWSLRAAVVASLGVGTLALLLDPGPLRAAFEGMGEERAEVRYGRSTGEPAAGRAIPVLALLSGALVLGLEVLWTRMFALVHENSVYSFSTVLAVFLVGLAGGAALARALLARGISAGKLLGWALSGAGLGVVLSPRLFHALTSGMAYLAQEGRWTSHAPWILLWGAALMLPAVVLAGAVLPALMELLGEKGRKPAGQTLGRLLALNTLGALSGPLLAAFVLAPSIGLWWSISAAGALFLVLGELVLGGRSGRPAAAARRLGLWAALAAGLLLLDPGGLPRVRISGEKGESIVCLREGSHGTVAVVEDGSHRYIKVNNSYILGGTSSAGDERMQAHLPLLLHPAPRRVAFLGLGTGITAGAALLHPVESVVALEIVPEVIHAAKDHFADANMRVADDPRVEVVAEDARNFLGASGRSFDVIVGDLFVPWRPGESALYSQEHFQAVRRALAPGGIFCQWLPLFQLSEEGLRIIAATFLEVFPSASLWRGDFLADQPALALVGHRDGESIDPGAVDRRTEKLAAALAPRLDRTTPYLADPAGLWLFLVGPVHPGDPVWATARRNRDSRPWIEILTPLGEKGARERGPAAHGRFLEALAKEVRRRPLTGSPLERLGSEHLRYRDAGAALWSASVLAAEGKREGSPGAGPRDPRHPPPPPPKPGTATYFSSEGREIGGCPWFTAWPLPRGAGR